MEQVTDPPPPAMAHREPPPAGAEPAPKVAIVVLNWNDADTTLACLKALRETDYPNYTVIVVDNGSVDGSAHRIQESATADEFVQNPTNLGFTGGVNAGIQRAMAVGADYVWLLNSDALTQQDVLSRLIAAAEADARIGLVSPVFHDPGHPATIEFCLGRFDPVARYASQTNDPATARRWRRDYPDQLLLLGTALLIRRRLIETIGMLDPAFFAYVEDVDYSLRTHAAGFKVEVVPDAVVFHKFKQPVAQPGSVAPYLHYFMTRNYLLLWRKLPGPVLWRKAMLWFLHQRLTQVVRMNAHPVAVDAVLLGLWDGLRGQGGAFIPDRVPPWFLRVTLGRHPAGWQALLNGRNPFSRNVS